MSSALIKEATTMTVDFWRRKHGIPSVPLTTEVNPDATRRKRDPGRCFIKAGWVRVGTVNGLVILTTPVDQ